jgi:hypothetical protein
MEYTPHGDPDTGPVPEEEWVPPFRRALTLHGRPGDRHKWYIVWARRFAKRLGGGGVREATRKDVEAFLATLSTSPGIAPWQTDQAADSLRILIGSVIGQDWGWSIQPPAPPAPPPPLDIPAPRRGTTCRGG